MKVSTWMPKHSPLPRTLADVESSRGKPVLCWDVDKSVVLVVWIAGGIIQRVDGDGLVTICSNQSAKHYSLYSATPRPTNLEDVPDRRIVWARFSSGLECLLFREFDTWHGIERGERFSDSYMRGQDNGETPVEWQLTDHVAELVETEIGVV